MRGIPNDWPESLKNQAQAQLAAYASRNPIADAEHHQQTPLGSASRNQTSMVNLAGPLLVRITRGGGKILDDDNLAGGCKGLRDAIAQLLGRKGDSEKDGFTWEYVQNGN